MSFKTKKQKKDWKKREENEISMISSCTTEKQNLWHMESGCSKHITGDPNKFIKLRKYNKGKFTFADNMYSKIIGKGTDVVNNKINAENVLLVEKLKPNLLSVSQTCDQEHICIFDSEKCEIRKKDLGRAVGISIRNSNNVYILENENQCYLSMVYESWLWNKRLGHLNFDNLVKISKKQVVRDFPKIVKALNSICNHCQHGKQTRASFKIK